jgi:competence protein ComGC
MAERHRPCGSPAGTEACAAGQRGAILPELILTLLLVSFLVLVFVPGAVQKRARTNEAAAAATLVAIHNASAAFYSRSQPNRYPINLAELGAAVGVGLPAELATGGLAGYDFALAAPSDPDQRAGFLAEAHPRQYRRDGALSFAIDEAGRLRGEDIGGFPGRADMRPWSGPKQEVDQ